MQPPEKQHARPERRRILLAGLALGCGTGIWRSRSQARIAPAGSKRVWVADRGAGALIELDEALMPCRRLSLDAPRLVLGQGDRLWALAGHAPAERRVLTWDGLRSGELRPGPSWGLPGAEALWPDSLGGAWGLVRGATRLLLGRLRAEESLSGVLSFSANATASTMGQRLLIADSGRDQWLVFELGGIRKLRALRIGLDSDLQAATPAQDGGWWCLVGSSDPNLERYSARLERLWSRPVGFAATQLVPQGSAVWALGGRRLAGLRFQELGRAESCLEEGLRGPVRASQAWDTGILLALSGALISFSSNGRLESFQGGFGDLVALGVIPA